MLRQKSKGKESDRFISARSLEREKKLDKFRIKEDNEFAKTNNLTDSPILSKSQQPVVKTPKIIIDDKENSKKLYLSLLKSQIFNAEDHSNEKTKSTFFLSKKRSKIQTNNNSNFACAWGKKLSHNLNDNLVTTRKQTFYSLVPEKISVLKKKEFGSNDFNFLTDADATPQLKRVFFSKEFSNEFNFLNNNNNNNDNDNPNKHDEFESLFKSKKDELKVPFDLSTQIHSNLENSSSITNSNLKPERIENLINLSNSDFRANSLLSLENSNLNKQNDNFNFNNSSLDFSCKKNLNLDVFTNNINIDCIKNISDNTANSSTVNEFIERNKNLNFKDNSIQNSKLKEKSSLVSKDLLLSSDSSNLASGKGLISLKKNNSEINLFAIGDSKFNLLDNNSSIISNANTFSNFSHLSNLSFVKDNELNPNSSKILSPNDSDKLVLSQKRKLSSFIFDDFGNSSNAKINIFSDSFHIINKDLNVTKFNNELSKNSLKGSQKTIDYHNNYNNFSSCSKINTKNIDDFILLTKNNKKNFNNEFIDDSSYRNKNDFLSSNSNFREKTDVYNPTGFNTATGNSTISLNLNSDLNLLEKSDFDLNLKNKDSFRIPFNSFAKKSCDVLISDCLSNLSHEQEFGYENSKSASYKKLINFNIEKEIYKEINFNFKHDNSPNESSGEYINYLSSKLSYYNLPDTTLESHYNPSSCTGSRNSKNYSNSNAIQRQKSFLVPFTKSSKTQKKIPKAPYKVLDAPQLKDDFYLHLLDWSQKDFLAVGLEKSIYIWEGKSSNVLNLHNYENETISAISWLGNQEQLAVGLYSGKVDIWDPEANKILQSFTAHSDRIGVIAPMHQSNPSMFSSGSQDKQIFTCDLRQKVQVARCLGHSQEICGLKWSPDDRLLASGGNDNKLFLWNLKKIGSECEKKFNAHSSAIKAIDWSPHKFGFLLSGGGTQDRTIKLWNTQTMQLVESIDTSSQVCNIAFSRNSHEFVSTHGYSDNLILVWDADKMEVKASLKGHKDRVIYLSVGPDGEKIVTGAGDETIRFWDVFENKFNWEEEQFFKTKLDLNCFGLR